MTSPYAQERRALLEYVLKEYVKKGGQLIVPRGQAFNDPSLLDQLDGLAVLRSIPYTDIPLDLGILAGIGPTNTIRPINFSATGGHSNAAAVSRIQPTGVSPEGIPIYGAIGATIKLESGWSAQGDVQNPFATASNNPPESTAQDNNPFLLPSKKRGANSQGGAGTGGGAAPRHTLSAGGQLGVSNTGNGVPPAGPLRQAQMQAHHRHQQSSPAVVTAAPGTTQFRTTATTSAMGAGSALAEESSSADGVAPSLQMPLLETGISEQHLKELAYFIFAAACPAPTAATAAPPPPGARGPPPMAADTATAMLVAIRGQLELDESSARDVASIMRHVSTGYWTPQRRCSTEGVLTVMAQARAQDFNMLGGVGKGFRGWTRWRETLSDVLGCVGDLRHGALQKSPESRRLVARLRGALRRMDVKSPEEFDEEEYSEAGAALRDAVRGLMFCGLNTAASGRRQTAGSAAGQTTPSPAANGWATFDSPPPLGPGNGTAYPQAQPQPPNVLLTMASMGSGGSESVSSGAGWKLPWAIRARLAEILLAALFDTINEGSYIDEVAAVQAALEAHVWPALGVSSTLSLALSAWVHFRQYIATGQAWLARQLKLLVTKLSTAAAKSRSNVPLGNADRAASLITPLTLEEEHEADALVAAEVGRLVVDQLLDRLSDYHQHYPPGSEQAFQVLLDTTASAATARGDTPAQLAAMMLEVVTQSVNTAWRRACQQNHDPSNTGEQQLLVGLAVAEDVTKVDQGTYAHLLLPYLPHQPAVVAVTLHRLVGEQLMGWVRNGVTLDQGSVDVLRAAVVLDQNLGHTVTAAQKAIAKVEAPGRKPGSAPVDPVSVVSDALRGFVRWELDGFVQQAMEKWVGRRVEAISTWAERQLAAEKWTPVSASDGYSTSSVEVMVMVSEAVEAVFAMQLPVGQRALTMMLNGVNTIFTKYAECLLRLIGSPSRLVPPMPTVTRYKKPFVIKQEQVELDLIAATTPGLAGRKQSKGAMTALKDMFTLTPKGSSGGGAGSAEEERRFLESVPNIQSSPEFAKMKDVTPATIACWMLSAHYLSQKLDTLITTAYKGWTSPPQPPGRDAEWIPSTLAGCRQQLLKCSQTACVFLATKVVFWDMRHAWLEKLYRHHVPGRNGMGLQPPYSTRIDPLLEALNQALTEACVNLPDDLRTLVATELLTAAATAWQRVILDGGPCRWFIPADVPALREDLDALQQLFEADGEGLPSSSIEPILRPCRRMLLLVGCDLAQLMNMLRTARISGKATLQMPQREPEVFDEYSIMRVLARRPERTGSKLLKKEYKMGRRLK